LTNCSLSNIPISEEVNLLIPAISPPWLHLPELITSQLLSFSVAAFTAGIFAVCIGQPFFPVSILGCAQVFALQTLSLRRPNNCLILLF